MDQLALEAGISKRTIYSYFRSKDEIIATVIEKLTNEIEEELDKIIENNTQANEIFEHIPPVFVRLSQKFLTPVVLNDLRLYYPQHWQKINHYRLAKVEKLINKVLRESDNQFIQELDSRIITQAMLASLQAVSNPEFIIDNNLTLEYTVNNLSQFFKYIFVKDK